MTILSNSELEKISNNEFSLDFLRARLVQQIPDSPKEYSGSGCISQSEGGELELKLYCPVDSGDKLFEEVGRGYSEPGQLIEAESYFSFEGVDVFGQIWTARNIWVNADVSFPASGCIIRSKIKSIENRRAQPTNASLARKKIIVPGAYKVPFTDVQPNTKESGYSACTIDFAGGCTCSLKRSGNSLVINMSSGGSSHAAYFKRVVEAIGVAVGAHLVAQIEIEVSGDERIQIVRSLNKGASEGHRLLPPIPIQHPHHFADFQDFVRAYVNRFSEPFSQLAGFWYRILIGFDNGLENQALVLTTAIEGVLKAYFKSEGQPDEEFLRQVTDAIPKIKALNNLELRARERILSTLGNAKKPTPSNALKKLSDLEVIPHRLVTVWKGLRNKVAHADELNFDSENIQAFVDQLYACLELFYRLVFWLVGYGENIVEYSRCGWPEVKLGASS